LNSPEEFRAAIIDHDGKRPALLSVAEFALAAGVGQHAIRERVADGTIRSLRIGRLVKVPASELQDWPHREAK
jgi:excisionase family DNA binding protein